MGGDADLIRRMTDEVFLNGRVDAIDELLADDFVSHDPPPEIAGTRDGYKELAAMVTTAMTNVRLEYDEYIETADGRVVESWLMVATHAGEAFGLPPSNQEVQVRGIEIWRCADGKIAEHWGAVDMSDVFMKAGPPPG